MESEQAVALADTIRRRRVALGMGSPGSAARRSGGKIATTTWRRLENPQQLAETPPRADTLAVVASVLQMQPGTLLRLGGYEYDELEQPPANVNDLEQRVASVEQVLVRLLAALDDLRIQVDRLAPRSDERPTP